MPIGFDDIVGEVMDARPATIRVFLISGWDAWAA